MHLFLQRGKSEVATPGDLFIGGEWFCNTIEPKYVNPGVKIMGQTAVPAGCYFIWLRESPSFGRVLPTIMNIPNFTNVLIHRGNRVIDTLACILVGFKKGSDADGPVIWKSQKAEEELMRRMLEAEKQQVIAITIKDAV